MGTDQGERMTRRILSAVFAALILIPSALLAHGGHKHKTLMGTVKTIDKTHISLKTTEGRTVSVPLVKNTMFMRGEKMVGADQVKTGTRVVIVLGEDDKSAQHVKIGTAKGK